MSCRNTKAKKYIVDVIEDLLENGILIEVSWDQLWFTYREYCREDRRTYYKDSVRKTLGLLVLEGRVLQTGAGPNVSYKLP